MSSKKHINQEVDKTMQALDGMEPAKTDPFFYSRLSAKLDRRDEVQDKVKTFPDFGFTFTMAAVFIFLLLNLASISLYRQVFVEEEAGQQELFEEIAYEYQVFDLNYYETFEEE